MKIFFFIVLVCVSTLGCAATLTAPAIGSAETSVSPVPDEKLSPEIRKILESAEKQTRVTTNYTQKYFVIPYPNGDVPEDTGACTDVIVRAFRSVGIDLQKEVHEDMAGNFGMYPKKWGLPGPDSNIDHRRVPNLQTFFTRRGKSIGPSDDPADYKPGDIVTWDLDGRGMTHIGIVSDVRDETSGRPFIFHNIGGGARLEDRLFEWKITGRYRYFR